MTTTATPTTTAVTARVPHTSSAGSVARALVVGTVAAGAVTEAFTAIVRAAGVHLVLDAPHGHGGTPITFGACAFSILLCMIAGTALTYAVRRYAGNARRVYVYSAAALTALSLAAPLLEPTTSTGTRLTLIVAHLLAAAIIVPSTARTL